MYEAIVLSYCCPNKQGRVILTVKTDYQCSARLFAELPRRVFTIAVAVNEARSAACFMAAPHSACLY